ncbi:high choriolytic enzyme 1 [Scomber scombrus]|uniref:high choriolytic enzyme 1 n=1 Tax=Scomber scombrus TaxID=13677 RepID=UPI002DDB5C91|nr:high choriolytic enzyme 1 [Scomber scombrus]
MLSTMMLLGILFGLLTQAYTLPVKNSTGVHEGKVRLKRKYSDETPDWDEMNIMDKIMEVNNRLRAPRGMSFKEGDIASSYIRSAITCPGNTCLWPKSVDGFVYVPYIISPVYDDMDRITIETGMQDISSGTCIKFVPRTHEASFLDIQPRYGCWSFLGQTGGSQTLSLQTPGCMWSGVASHEFMHALGFVHEQSRSDRDHYITIIWKNIMPDYINNFRKHITNNLNSPYDYSSVMHYGRYAFSEDGGPTIIPKPDPYIPIGQRDGPSALDLHKINVLYDCGKRTNIYTC